MRIVFKFSRALWVVFAAWLAAFVTSPVCASPVVTRASQLKGMAVGMGKLLHMTDYLQEYPGSRTAILSYFKMDSMDVNALIADLRIQAALQTGVNRDFAP